MNISSNLNAAVAATFKSASKPLAKVAAQAGAEPSPDSADSVETLSFGTSALRYTSNAAPGIPGITDTTDAESEVVYLKNVILALPALVLRAQANPPQDSRLRLL